jgi:hypothetical protein
LGASLLEAPEWPMHPRAAWVLEGAAAASSSWKMMALAEQVPLHFIVNGKRFIFLVPPTYTSSFVFLVLPF